ncbi:hypothetical protein PENSPDRAFT_570425 [Peniophora sp. CONT]|nr:hypothetical protein PENSPDRAFT_570425 [Peniophora sp. CONT]
MASSSASATELERLKTLTFQRLHPHTYLERLLAEGVRPDGRLPHEWRDVSVNVGSISTADGSSLIRLGDTIIVCGVKAEIAQTELDTPNHGFLVPNLDLPAMSSPKFKPGPPSEEAQIISSRLYEALLAADVVPLETLCIHPGKAAWVLYVDATCINYDGNAFDAALIAMVAALKNVRLPKATYDEDTDRTTCSRKTREPLQLGRLPAAYSVGIFDQTTLLVDPTSFEEPLMDAHNTVILDEKHELLSVSSTGFAGLSDQDHVRSSIELAKQQHALVADALYSS